MSTAVFDGDTAEEDAVYVAKKELRKQMKQKLSHLSKEEIETQCPYSSSPLLGVQHVLTMSAADAVRLLFKMPEVQSCRTISIFMSMPTGEVQTGPIVRRALSMQKTVYIPYIYKVAKPDQGHPAQIMDMLQLQGEEDYASLEPDKWGIPSIEASSIDERENSFGGKGLTHGNEVASNENSLDVVIMPSVAFDTSMNRLGHGKGYYDNFLSRCYPKAPVEGRPDGKPYLSMHFQQSLPPTTSSDVFAVGLALKDQMLPSESRIPTTSLDFPVDAVIFGDQMLRSPATPGVA